jgi:hypothetical protein
MITYPLDRLAGDWNQTPFHTFMKMNWKLSKELCVRPKLIKNSTKKNKEKVSWHWSMQW